jgi:hypothetical protein
MNWGRALLAGCSPTSICGWQHVNHASHAPVADSAIARTPLSLDSTPEVAVGTAVAEVEQVEVFSATWFC